VVRLFKPLVAWALLALALWKGLAHLTPVTPLVAALVTTGAVFLTTPVYILLACRGGPYPKRAWWVAPGALLVGGVIAVFLPVDGEQSLARTLCFLAASPVLGDMLSRLVEDRRHLLPALAVAVAADTWSVFFGPSKTLVETGASKYLTVHYPVAGYAAAPPIQIMGVMDMIFLAFLAFVTLRFDLPRRRLWAAVGLGMGAGVVVLTVLATPIPLLATIAPAYALVYLRQLLPGRKELRTTLLFLAALIGLFWLLSRFRGEPAGAQPAPPPAVTDGPAAPDAVGSPPDGP